MLSFLLGNWKAVAYGLLTAFLIVFALKVSHWYQRAQDADVAEANYAEELRKGVQYQKDILIAYKQLSEKKTEIQWKTKEIVKSIPYVVKDVAGCEFSPDTIRMLNAVKKLSPASPRADAEARAASPQP